ncbi:MAG: helix-turn-helix domain-containing protein [Gammaproteobacteria bacterium]|jgi:transcriptional regulator with XRE-family HTH domain
MAINDNLLENLGSIIRYHRKKCGINYLELAKLAQVGKTTVFDIEHSKKTIRFNTMLKILDVLNITIELKSPLMSSYKNENS